MMRPSLALITALLCLSPLAPPAVAATAPRAPRLDFELQVAERRALTARSPEAFADAADALGTAIAQGHRNRVTLYNHGTLLLLGKRYAEAEAALEAAECISGTTWGIRRNLRLARSEGHKERLQSLAWQRIPLFWHFELSLATRLTVAAAASLLCWIALTLLLTRHRRLGRYLLAIGVATIVCFGTSVVSSLSRSRPVPFNEETP
jgi:hypothetical protein